MRHLNVFELKNINGGCHECQNDSGLDCRLVDILNAPIGTISWNELSEALAYVSTLNQDQLNQIFPWRVQ